MNALRKKRPAFYANRESILLHHDNAPSHTSFQTLITINLQLGAEILTHPPYSPDLAPCDFALFPRLKSELRGHSFKSVLELKTAVNQTIGSYKSDWYQSVFDSWVYRHEKCLKEKGEYFEKMWRCIVVSDVKFILTTTPGDPTLYNLIGNKNIIFCSIKIKFRTSLHILLLIYYSEFRPSSLKSLHFIASVYELFDNPSYNNFGGINHSTSLCNNYLHVPFNKRNYWQFIWK